MRRFGHFTRDDLVQSVDALAIGIEGVHEMHVGRLFVVSETGLGPLV